MAVITPGSLAGFYTGTAQRAPSQGRRYIPSGKETEAQRLSRESNEAIAEASRKDRLALGITSAVLSGANTLLDFGLQAYKLGQDPAEVRKQVAQSRILGEGAAELESGIDLSPLQPTAPSGPDDLYENVIGAPKPDSFSPLAPQAGGQQAQQSEPLKMSRGDLDLLISSMGQIKQQYGLASDGSSPRGRQQLVMSTANRLGGNVEEAEKLVRSMIGQGSFLEQNYQQMIDSGALVLEEGPPTDFWKNVASGAPKGGWKGPREVSQAITGVEEAGGRQSGQGMPGYMSKLAQVREQTGDDVLLAKVVDGVMKDPQAGAQLLQEAKAVAPAFDWDSLASSAAKGDRAPIIKAYVKALSMTPDQLRAESPVVGVDQAMALFGEDGELRIPRTASIGSLQKAYAALEEAGETEKAAMLLEPSAWGRTSDWRSVVPSSMAARPEDAAQSFISGGKAERGNDPVSKARTLYQLALSEGDLRRKEKDSQAKLMRARKPLTLGSHVDHKARTKGMTEEDWKASWRARKEYQTVRDALGEDMAEEKLDLAYKARNSKNNPLYTAHVQLSKVNEEADKDAARGREEKQQTVVQTQSIKNNIRKKKAELTTLANTWGIKLTPGSGNPGQDGYQPMTFAELNPGTWLVKRNAQIAGMNVDAGGKVSLRDQADARQQEAAAEVNRQIATLMADLEDLMSDLYTYQSAGNR